MIFPSIRNPFASAILAASALVGASGGLSGQDTALVAWLDLALPHVRAFVPEGRIQFDPGAQAPTGALRAWAREGGNGVGPGEEVLDCRPRDGCRASGGFRGLVEVEVLERTDTAAKVRLSIYRAHPTYRSMQLVVDELHFALREGAWIIRRLVRVGES